MSKSNFEQKKKFWEKLQHERDSKDEGVQVVEIILRKREIIGGDPVRTLE